MQRVSGPPAARPQAHPAGTALPRAVGDPRCASCPGRPDPGAFAMEREGRVSVFYEGSLGLYPFYSPQEQPVTGGLPQHTGLDAHLEKTRADVMAALPAAEFQGLGVVCWEKWAPQWVRNRGKKAIYQRESRALLRGFFPDWSRGELDEWAQVNLTQPPLSTLTPQHHFFFFCSLASPLTMPVVDFEAAAQAILMETLQEVRKARPQALWGMAPYPSCYNSGPAQRWANYTGRCPAAEMALNDQLLWLWKRSSALYPTLLLDKLLGGTPGAALCLQSDPRGAAGGSTGRHRL
ncbi:hypothetical protein AAFF_G00059400 [Aldrovandia affinis]|uniref:Hyaluronidase n=1 Tax=Aldrovandia affinis TaxID=143900 RepID=A0AAD7RZX9_9TELE|nr:hypothetical protein AAFF_G00059400 [Aldrovandia affinis]